MFKNASLIVFSHSFRPNSKNLLKNTIQYIRSISNAKLVLLGNSPIYKYPLPNIVKKGVLYNVKGNAVVPSKSMWPEFWKIELILKQIAKEEGVFFLSKTDYFCPNHECLVFTHDGKQLSTFDKHHLSYESAVAFGKYLNVTRENEKFESRH
jgi:hypothetical protein